MFGFLNVNKPSGITSHKVISVLRKITGIKQIGHAGTLDPLACGVLPIAIGKCSKLIDYLPTDKSYKVTMNLGKVSDTYDIEGKVEETGARKITLEEIEAILPKFRGKTKQIPPAFSAVHYNGKRLYELARSGNIPDDIPSRDIVIYKNELISFDYENQILKLDIECSKGTYIRTIVNDIGQELGCGAVMSELIRTMSATMLLEDAIDLDSLKSKEDVLSKLISPVEILKLGKLTLKEQGYKKVLNGNYLENSFDLRGEALLLYEGKVVALAECKENLIHPKKVLL